MGFLDLVACYYNKIINYNIYLMTTSTGHLLQANFLGPKDNTVLVFSPGAPASWEAHYALHWQQCALVFLHSMVHIPQGQTEENFAGTIRRLEDIYSNTMTCPVKCDTPYIKSCIKVFNRECYSLITLIKRSVGGKMPKQIDRRIQPRKKLPRLGFSWSCLQIWQ